MKDTPFRYDIIADVHSRHDKLAALMSRRHSFPDRCDQRHACHATEVPLGDGYILVLENS